MHDGRGASDPGSTRFGRARFHILLVVAAISIVASCAPPPPPIASDLRASTRLPVVIVHGFEVFCGGEDEFVWREWIREATSVGYAPDSVTVFPYDSCGNNDEIIARLGTYIDGVMARTGAKQVNIVAHSVGSILSRSCIRFGGCAGKVDKLVSVAGANHGTIWGAFCPIAIWAPSCADVAPDSARLRALNEGDETWGDTEYVTMRSWCELVILPYTSTVLDGAYNINSDRCLGHTDWRNDFTAARWTFAWFDGAALAPLPAGS